MTESDFWSVIRDSLKPFGLAKRVEDSTDLGVADVFYNLTRFHTPALPRYATGWLELKNLPEWPKRPTTPIKLPHYTREQSAFLGEWDRPQFGCPAGLLLRVVKTNEYVYFTGARGAQIIINEAVYKDDLRKPWTSGGLVWDHATLPRGFPTARVLSWLIR